MRLAPVRTWLFRALAALLVLVVVVEGWYAARIVYLREHDPELTAFMARELNRLRQTDPGARLRQQWVPYGRIAPALKRAVIVAEDAKFVEHAGFDWDGIEAALRKNLERGRVVAGGSTISQQLAKNLFLSGERSFWRKGQEAVLTVMLEAILPKRRLFELYLNVIEWGEGLFGAEAAARYYFGVDAAALDERQAALLAAMVPRPRFYQGRGFTPVLRQRAAVIEERMPRARIP